MWFRRVRRVAAEYPWTIFFATLLIAVNAAGVIRWRRQRLPRYAIDQTAKAVRQHDSAQFQLWVDTECLAGSYYDQHLLPERLKTKTADEANRKREVQAIARRLRRWVETSRIDTSETPRLTLLGTVLRSAIMKGSGSISSVTAGGGISIAVIELEDEVGRKASLELKLERQRSGEWRIVEVTNVDDVVDMLRKEEAKRVAIVQGQIDAAAKVTSILFQKSDGVTWNYLATFQPINASHLEYIVSCHTSTSTHESRAGLMMTGVSPKTVSISCPCATTPCQPPMVLINAVRKRSDDTVIRRVEALPLD